MNIETTTAESTTETATGHIPCYTQPIDVIYLESFVETFKRIPDNSLDLIITDPPYPREYMWVWEILAKEAKRTLKDGASLITLLGHYQLLEVGNILSEELRYWWIGSLSGNRSNRIFGKNVITKHKPILWFLKGKRGKTKYVPIDHIHTTPENWDKTFHKWQQPVDYFEMYIKNLTNENDVVYDPFMGAGTTAFVCKLNNRRYIGSENDEKSFTKCTERLLGCV